MSENNQTLLTNISKASSVEEIAKFWDTHSLDDYWDQTYEVDFTITAKRRYYVTFNPEIFEQAEGL